MRYWKRPIAWRPVSVQSIYRALKRNPISSAVMQAVDIQTPRRLEGHLQPIYSRLISNHWVRDDYESTARASFRTLVREIGAKSLFDIGANVGIYAMEFLSAVPQGKVVAVEPNRLVFRCLAKTCQPFGMSAIPVCAAVSDQPGEVEISYDPLSPAMGGIVPGADGLFNSQRLYGATLVSDTVNAVTLAQLAKQFFLPDFVKIDVEGAEILVFSGGAEVFRGHKPALLFEFSESKPEITALLESWGYLFFDEYLKEIAYPEFATFALHGDKHREAIDAVRGLSTP